MRIRVRHRRGGGAADAGRRASKAGAKHLIVSGGPPKVRSRTVSRPREFVKTGTLALMAGREQARSARRSRRAAGDGVITAGDAARDDWHRPARRNSSPALDGNGRARTGRRADARPRRHPETRAAARRPRTVAHLRALPHAGGEVIQGRGLPPDLAWTSPTSTSAWHKARRRSHPRRRARTHHKQSRSFDQSSITRTDSCDRMDVRG